MTWSNIHVHNATFPIFATGVYFDQVSGIPRGDQSRAVKLMLQNTNRGLTPGNYPANSTATHISNFEWINVTGTINDVYPGDGSCVTNPCCESERHIETPGHI